MSKKFKWTLRQRRYMSMAKKHIKKFSISSVLRKYILKPQQNTTVHLVEWLR